MLGDFLEEATVLIVGKPGEQLAKLLHSKTHVNEFNIAKKLDLTINQTRNLLYRVSDQGIVSYVRKKDKKKGWYTYFWKIEIIKALEFLRAHYIKRLEQIQNQVNSRETKQFYVCDRCNREFNEQTALAYDFTCDECGDVFALKDNTRLVKELKKHLEKYTEILNELDVEIEKEKEKEEKLKQKEIEVKKKEAAAKRAAKRKATTKTTKKKTVKKVVKKKTTKKKTSKKLLKKKVAKKKTAKKIVKKKVVKKKVAKKTVKKKTVKKKVMRNK